MSNLDPFFDHTFIDIERDIQSIDDGQKELSSFFLLPYLKNPRDFNLQSFKTSLAAIHGNNSYACFDYNNFNTVKECLRIIRRTTENANKSFASRYISQISLIDGCTPAPVLNFVFMIFKRFRQQFKLPDFLYCSNIDVSHNNIVRQMIQSQLHFLKYGVYLPIIAIFLGQMHATALLIVPVQCGPDDEDQDENMNSASPDRRRGSREPSTAAAAAADDDDMISASPERRRGQKEPSTAAAAAAAADDDDDDMISASPERRRGQREPSTAAAAAADDDMISASPERRRGQRAATDAAAAADDDDMMSASPERRRGQGDKRYSISPKQNANAAAGDYPEVGNITGTKWHFINVDPEGSRGIYQRRFDQIPNQALHDFKLFFSTCRIHTLSSMSTCLDNIQKNYKTCAQWTILLTIQILANINNFRGNFSMVNNFFRNLSKQTLEIQSLDEFNNCIFEFMIFFHKLILGVFAYIGGENQLFIPSFNEILREIIRGKFVEKNMNPDAKIYQTMTTIQNKLQPYFKEDYLVVFNEEMEEKKTLNFAERTLQFNKNQYILENLKDEMHFVAKKSGTSSCEFNRLKRQFLEKARGQLLELLIFDEGDKTPEQWVENWYEQKLHKKIDFLRAEQTKSEVLRNHSSGSLREHYTINLQTLGQQLAVKMYELKMHEYQHDSVDFFMFLNEIEASLSRLDVLQKELINLKNRIQVMTKKEHEEDIQILFRLQTAFYNMYNELLFHIENTLQCGRNPNEWLAGWFRLDMSRDIKRVLAESQNPRAPEAPGAPGAPGSSGSLAEIMNQLWNMYKSNKNIEMASDFLAFVNKNRIFMETNTICNNLQQVLIRMKTKMQSDGLDIESTRRFRETLSELLALLPQIHVTPEKQKQWVEWRFREHYMFLLGNYQSKIDEMNKNIDEFIGSEEQETLQIVQSFRQQLSKLNAKKSKLLEGVNQKIYLKDAAEFMTFANHMRKRYRNELEEDGGEEGTGGGGQEKDRRTGGEENDRR